MNFNKRRSGVLACAVLIAIPVRAQSPNGIESQLREIARTHPDSFDANYQIAEYYFHSGKLRDGIPYMEKAQSLDPSNYVSGYDLALAYFEVHDYPKARQQIEVMLSRRDSAELHSLLADVEEATGNYVRAAEQYQQASRMDPTEDRIFDWGTELLAHSAWDAAIEVFSRGVALHPESAKLNLGLGVALYSHHDYEGAVKALCAAADLQPSQSWPYVFLGKLYNIASGVQAGEVRKRLAHFVQIQPANAEAFYYYALSLWNRDENSDANLAQVESLLNKAVTLNAQFADAHLQLGILYADERKYADAIRELQKATTLQPNSATAHYHLAQAYMRTGEKPNAQQELQAFERLRKQEQAETEKQRQQLTQLIVSLRQQEAAASR